MSEQVRPELGVLPPRIARLPVDKRGYPVPWFVAWIDGEPEFRAMDPDKWTRAVREKRCWVCGDHLGVHLTFPIGPMCALNRTIAEPPSHHDCAAWSVRHCPFLSRPHMVRREDETTAGLEVNVAGSMIKRNPGVTCLWTTRRYSIFNDGTGKPLIEIGEPERVEWFAEGRPATREEVAAATDSGMPFLHASIQQEATARRQREAIEELTKRRAAVEQLWPASEVASC